MQRRGRPDAIVLRDASGLEALRDGWQRLADRAAPTPMQDPAWTLAAVATVEADLPLRVVVVGDVDAPRAVAPLVRRGPHLQIVGAEPLSEPSALLYEDERALDELAAAVARLRTPVLLRRLPAGGPASAALTRAFRPLGVVLTRPASGHPVVALHDGWTRPAGALSSRRASDIRRARRRAEARGTVAAELLAPAPEAVDALLDDAFAIEARSWKGRAGTALALDGWRAAFFRRYARVAAERGELRIAFLRVGQERVAMQVSLAWRDRLWLLKIGHDDALARCSPGSLLMLEVLRDAAAQGLQAVQLLGSAEEWTRMWTEDVAPCETLAAYPPVPASLLSVVSDARAVVRRRRAAAVTGR